jgi:hypothetical protein
VYLYRLPQLDGRAAATDTTTLMVMKHPGGHNFAPQSLIVPNRPQRAITERVFDNGTLVTHLKEMKLKSRNSHHRRPTTEVSKPVKVKEAISSNKVQVPKLEKQSSSPPSTSLMVTNNKNNDEDSNITTAATAAVNGSNTRNIGTLQMTRNDSFVVLDSPHANQLPSYDINAASSFSKGNDGGDKVEKLQQLQKEEEEEEEEENFIPRRRHGEAEADE